MEIQIVQSQLCISQESRSRISCIDKDDAGDGYGNRFARFDDCNEPRIHDDSSIRNSGSGGPSDTCRSDDTNREDCIPARQGMIPPPAPRKPKAKPRGNYALRKGGCNFFTPPDLELFFASISSSSNIF
ncbi:hypothetical protein KP509_11G009200 [Ceratopteris richardii]|nr:hypothetical protein KP509_11G009200 [Ceratopteris richardii]